MNSRSSVIEGTTGRTNRRVRVEGGFAWQRTVRVRSAIPCRKCHGWAGKRVELGKEMGWLPERGRRHALALNTTGCSRPGAGRLQCVRAPSAPTNEALFDGVALSCATASMPTSTAQICALVGCHPDGE